MIHARRHRGTIAMLADNCSACSHVRFERRFSHPSRFRLRVTPITHRYWCCHSSCRLATSGS